MQSNRRSVAAFVVALLIGVNVYADAKQGYEYSFEAVEKLHQYHYRSNELNDAALFDGGLEGIRALFLAHGMVWETPGIHASNTVTTARMQFIAKMDEAIAWGAEKGISKEEIAITAAKALVATMRSSHSILLSEREAESWQRYDDGLGRYYGIGATLMEIEGIFVIANILPDGPAARAGLLSLDRIIAIDGKAPSTLEETQTLLRGTNGVVRVRISRNGTVGEASINRNAYRTNDSWVDIRRFTKNGKRVTYMRLRAFTINDSSIVDTMLAELENNHPDGIVIDLRENSGGSGAIVGALLSVFLNHGKRVFRATCPSRNELIVIETNDAARYGFPQAKIPASVLIGSGTRCAAEIFAYAMQKYGRAQLIGTPTNGFVEGRDDIRFLSGPLMCVAITKIEMMDGVILEGRGVRPDRLVPMRAYDALRGRDTQFETALDELAR